KRMRRKAVAVLRRARAAARDELASAQAIAAEIRAEARAAADAEATEIRAQARQEAVQLRREARADAHDEAATIRDGARATAELISTERGAAAEGQAASLVAEGEA